MKKGTILKTKKGYNLRLLILIVLLSFVTLKSQTNPILNSDHIPLLGFGWGSEAASLQLDANDLEKIKEMGLEGVMFTNLTQDRFDMFQSIQNEVKLFPYQTNSTLTNGINYISYYCDAYYSNWQAVDVTNSDVKATLSFDTTIGERTTETPNCIVTKSSANAGTLIFGPGYRQRIKYEAINTDSLIRYTTTFRLMIKQDTSFQNPPLSTEELTDDLCKIIIRVKQILYDTLNQEYYVDSSFDFQSRTIKVNELDFNIWEDFSFDFNYAGLDPIFKKSTNKILKMNDKNIFADYVEYVVEWLNVPYARLYFDNVIVYDPRGFALLNYNNERDKIRNQANNRDPNYNIVFSEGLTNFENTMIGFYGIDEPETIDQLEPVRIVGNLIKEATNNKRFLFTSVASSWDGKYGSSNFGTEALNKVSEFYHRALPDGFIVQTHLFHYPDQNNWQSNIENTLKENLKELKNTSTTPIVLVQAGKWLPYVSEEPTPEQLTYTVNFSLLYGAKAIVFDQLFYRDQNITGIIKTDEPLPVTSPLFDEIKNKLSFRLKNELGKTLRKLTPTDQYLNHILSSSEGFIQSIVKGGCTVQGMQPNNEIYELGFFKDDLDKDYFMLISRWYNPGCNPALTINIKPEYFPDYYNLKVVNVINNTTLATITKYGNIYAAPEVGDACFFSIAPVVIYGGSLAYNDTIKTNTTLIDNLTIESAKVLQINSGKYYTLNDTVTFANTTSFITGDGYLERSQGGWITIKSWDKSLFKGKSGSHPKIIWGKHPDISNVIEYKIYRNYASEGWQYLTSKSNSTFEYIDTTITIIEGIPQANEVSTEYRVTATCSPSKLVIETSPSNTITYQRVEGQGLEKQNSGLRSNDFTYNLDQNYPNPFNPNTTINYSIAEDGLVEIEILNILGEGIKTLVNEFKTKGNHNISFNASSLASGVYIYKIQAGDFITSKKMVLLK